MADIKHKHYDTEDGREYDYDVALSFAGEQREYVQEVAAALRFHGVRPFYDDYEKANLWGKDLYEHLDWVYQKAARYCVLFASADYARKVWTSHERRSAQARALADGEGYVLPARFDDTEIPGLRPTVHYIDLKSTQPDDLVKLILNKLGPRRRQRFYPPIPDKLFEALGVELEPELDASDAVARSFMDTLIRMTVEERRLVAHLFGEGCRSELPDNIHMSLDIVRRDLGIAPADTMERLRGLHSLGFEEEIREDKEEHGDDVIVLRWSDTIRHDDKLTQEYAFEWSTEVAVTMLDVGKGDEGCAHCAQNCVDDLDFGGLSSTLS